MQPRGSSACSSSMSTAAPGSDSIEVAAMSVEEGVSKFNPPVPSFAATAADPIGNGSSRECKEGGRWI